MFDFYDLDDILGIDFLGWVGGEKCPWDKITMVIMSKRDFLGTNV